MFVEEGLTGRSLKCSETVCMKIDEGEKQKQTKGQIMDGTS